MQTIIQIIIGFIVFFILFGLLERLFPASRDKPVFRKGYMLDMAYWVMAPTINAFIRKGAVILVLLVLGLAYGIDIKNDAHRGFGPLAQQPLWLMVVEVLLLGDLISYWVHRWFHQKRLWKIHAVHHSSEQLDWLSSVRVHPLNQVIANSISVAILFSLGFPLKLLGGYLPFLVVYSIFLHANVAWSFGPLRYVIASPRFHRWHHTSEAEGQDKNFAGLFPVFDLLFGTFYMPKDTQPVKFGVSGSGVPDTLWAQLCYPFSTKK